MRRASSLGLGTAGSILMIGLVGGWARSRYPVFGAIPEPAQRLLMDIGLIVFIAVVGLHAGPHAVEAYRASGGSFFASIFVAGVIVTTVPLAVGTLVGRYVLKLSPLMLVDGLHARRSSPAPRVPGRPVAARLSGSAAPRVPPSPAVPVAAGPRAASSRLRAPSAARRRGCRVPSPPAHAPAPSARALAASRPPWAPSQAGRAGAGPLRARARRRRPAPCAGSRDAPYARRPPRLPLRHPRRLRPARYPNVAGPRPAAGLPGPGRSPPLRALRLAALDTSFFVGSTAVAAWSRPAPGGSPRAPRGPRPAAPGGGRPSRRGCTTVVPRSRVSLAPLARGRRARRVVAHDDVHAVHVRRARAVPRLVAVPRRERIPAHGGRARRRRRR